jgi:hypothetical protein
MKTNVYVDSFKLYYGCLRGTAYRWLDVMALCNLELPSNTINRIRCFTATVAARPNDLTQPERQSTYLRALRTIPNLTIHLGHFLESKVHMPYVDPPSGGPNTAFVRKMEEKGSDVNLAAYLLLDGFKSDYEAAIVISNDSDLAEPVRMVRREFGLSVVMLMPCCADRKPSVQLRRAANKHKIISTASLAASQFPPVLHDKNGTITKPASW